MKFHCKLALSHQGAVGIGLGYFSFQLKIIKIRNRLCLLNIGSSHTKLSNL